MWQHAARVLIVHTVCIMHRIHLNHEFIVSGPRFEKAVGVFARYLFKQAVDTTQYAALCCCVHTRRIVTLLTT